MTTCPYSSDEFNDLHRVLEEIIAEAKQSSPSLEVGDIIERLFDLADHGERDASKLRNAVVGRPA